MIYLLKLRKSYYENEMPALAVQTAFYLVLSIFPLMFLFISLSDNLYVSADSAKYFLPESILEFFGQMVASAPKGAGVTGLSILGTLWAASKSIYALMKGIHRAFTSNKLKFTFKSRGIAVVFTFVFALSIISSVSVLVLWDILSEFVQIFSGVSGIIIEWLRYAVAGAEVFIFILLLYRFSSGVKMRYLYTGAAFAAVGWIILTMGFELYMKYFNKYVSLFGSIGAFLGLVLWFLFISKIILIGAEINSVRYANKQSAIIKGNEL